MGQRVKEDNFEFRIANFEFESKESEARIQNSEYNQRSRIF
jgi:hypothetical protein